LAGRAGRGGENDAGLAVGAAARDPFFDTSTQFEKVIADAEMYLTDKR
jgi:hypothetical protein